MCLPLPLSPDLAILPSFPYPCTSGPPVWLRYGMGTGGGLGTWETTAFASQEATLPALPPRSHLRIASLLKQPLLSHWGKQGKMRCCHFHALLGMAEDLRC